MRLRGLSLGRGWLRFRGLSLRRLPTSLRLRRVVGGCNVGRLGGRLRQNTDRRNQKTEKEYGTAGVWGHKFLILPGFTAAPEAATEGVEC